MLLTIVIIIIIIIIIIFFTIIIITIIIIPKFYSKNRGVQPAPTTINDTVLLLST